MCGNGGTERGRGHARRSWSVVVFGPGIEPRTILHRHGEARPRELLVVEILRPPA